MIKVLILSHSSELAGAERSMLDLFDYWSKKNLVKPHLIVRRPVKNLAKELRKRGWSYTTLYYTNWSDRTPLEKRTAEAMYRDTLYNGKAILDIEELIQKIKPDVVMTNTIVSPWAAVAAYFQKVPHIWFVREYGDIDHRHIFELGREKMLEDIDTMSSLVVTNSMTLAHHIQQYMSDNKITTLYTPFDLELLRRKSLQKAKNPFIDQQSLKLIITGRIDPSKGQAEAAEAAGRLIQAGHDVELCVIGKPTDAEDAKSLYEIIKQYELQDRVHLVGHQSNPLAILKYADVGIMASKQEAFGRVTFEYMTIGLPVVGAASGATPELIDDARNGYLYEPGSIDSLVEKLMNYAKDRSLIKKHGQAAQAKAEKMMKGSHNADTLFDKISAIVNKKGLYYPQTLNFAHRWLEYQTIARRYIKDSGAISLKRLVYSRLRHRAKWMYLTTSRVYDFIRRGFRRSSSL